MTFQMFAIISREIINAFPLSTLSRITDRRNLEKKGADSARNLHKNKFVQLSFISLEGNLLLTKKKKYRFYSERQSA